MPLIAVQVRTLSTPKMMQDNLRNVLLKAGIPEYSYKEQRAGFQVWHAQDNEGETKIIWNVFTDDPDQGEELVGLERCAVVLLENYWVQLYTPNRFKQKYGRMHLRVLYGLHWLS